MKQEIPILIHRTLNDTADGLIKVFIPVAIFQYTHSLTAVIWYALIYYSLQSILNTAFYKHFVRTPKIFIFIRIVPLLVAQYVLQSSGFSNAAYLLLLAFSTGFANAFYWVPLNYIFASSTDKNIGQSISRFKIASIISKMITPIISGVIMTFYGLSVVVLLSTIIYLISIFVIIVFIAGKSEKLQSKQHDTTQPAVGGAFKEIAETPRLSFKTYFFTYCITGVNDTADMLWPLFIFMETNKYLEVGYVAALIQIGLIAANYFVGKRTDEDRWRIFASIALGCFSVIWFIRPHLLSLGYVYALSCLLGFIAPFFNVPLFAFFIKDSKISNRLARNLAYRDVAIKSGGSVSLLLFLFSGAIGVPFVLSAAASLFYIIPVYKSHQRC